MNKARTYLIPAGLFALFIVTRGIGLGKFVTIDEPAWFLFASNFFLALARGDLAHTSYDYHPAVTTLWVLTAAYLLYFRGYRALAKDYTEKYSKVEEIFSKYHKSPLSLLVIGRWISIIAIAVLVTLAYFFLDILLGSLSALVVSLLVILDPYFLGHSRLLNHESMMVAFILVSVLAALVFLYKRRQLRYLVVSGAACGFALLTKSPAIVLIPLTGLMFLVAFMQAWKDSPQRKKLFGNYAGHFILWVACLILVYFIFWPGMWVDPIRMLYTVYGNAISYAFQGARLSVRQEIRPETFQIEYGGTIFFLKTLFLKSTPVVWVGVILAAFGLGSRKDSAMSSIAKYIVLYFALLVGLFILMFGIAQGRNHIHYILMSFVSLDIIAGIGIVWGLARLANRYPRMNQAFVQASLVVGLLVIHGIGAVSQYPYYYTYTNPIARTLMPGFIDPGAAYGEGLELAASYLNDKPDPGSLKVSSVFSTGTFSYFFQGETIPLPHTGHVDDEYIQRVKNTDYLVIYSRLQKPSDMPARLLTALEDIPREHVIWLNGTEYIEIYRVADFSNAFYEAARN